MRGFIIFLLEREKVRKVNLKCYLAILMYFVMDDIFLILQDNVENHLNSYGKQADLELPKASGLNNFLYA